MTPNADFYVTSWGGTPQVDVRIPPVEQMLTLECISNPPDGKAISNAEWTGVKLRPLLEQAGVRRSAVYAAMHGADGYY